MVHMYMLKKFYYHGKSTMAFWGGTFSIVKSTTIKQVLLQNTVVPISQHLYHGTSALYFYYGKGDVEF